MQTEPQNSQSSSEVQEQQQVVAALCAAAPSNDVRDCLRKYDPSKPGWQIEAALKKFQKKLLVETLAYLGVPGMNEFQAAALPHELVCRVQNLFPDQCHLCHQSYCIKLDDKPIVSCAQCGQGCHNQCVLQLLNITEADLNEGNEPGKKILNPYAAIECLQQNE